VRDKPPHRVEAVVGGRVGAIEEARREGSHVRSVVEAGSLAEFLADVRTRQSTNRRSKRYDNRRNALRVSIRPSRAPENRGGRYGAIALDNLTHFKNDPVSRGSEGKVIMGAPRL
jgi:hypothetical protein